MLDDELILEILDTLEKLFVLEHALLEFDVDCLLEPGFECIVLAPLSFEENLALLFELHEELSLPFAALVLLTNLDGLLEDFGLFVQTVLDELGKPEAIVDEVDGEFRVGNLQALNLLLEAILLCVVLVDDILLYLFRLFGELVENILPSVIKLIDLLLIEFLELFKLLILPPSGFAQ